MKWKSYFRFEGIILKQFYFTLDSNEDYISSIKTKLGQPNILSDALQFVAVILLQSLHIARCFTRNLGFVSDGILNAFEVRIICILYII